MDRNRWIAAFMILFCSFAMQAQHQATGAQPDSSAREQANVNGQQSTTDSPQAASEIDSNNNGNIANASDANSGGSNAGQASEAASNVPAVPQSTSSQSGSPAMLADEGGRDGTNNVQRATMNMAGAPAANLNLEDRPEDADAEMKDRQNYSRDKRTSAKRNGDTSSGLDGINGKSRRENNAQSDQNLSSKDTSTPTDKGRKQNSENKARERKKKGR